MRPHLGMTLVLALLPASAGLFAQSDSADSAAAPASPPAPAETPKSDVAPASPPAPAGDDDTGWGEKHLGYAIHGRAEVRYVGRERAKVHDRDLYETLQLDLGTE
ncbi:MAG: hypothetical protein HYY93_12440, partial [Planctomycetes bacterium]|nr:hypothetical protein [Planctomycetota bacterium]